MSWQRYNQLIAYLTTCGETVSLTPPFPECRDPLDGYLLAMARVGDADAIVSNDKDLLCMSPFGDCKILTPEMFEVEFLAA
jgi:putative PIN family toxin of toxin-antitoxin system